MDADGHISRSFYIFSEYGVHRIFTIINSGSVLNVYDTSKVMIFDISNIQCVRGVSYVSLF